MDDLLTDGSETAIASLNKGIDNNARADSSHQDPPRYRVNHYPHLDQCLLSLELL